ncbi:kelch-like protein 24 [Argopecten irradians]|uniref:kelch-like protein 24 n=1 Tax=Argopecten irradians TaxID=31199 RepID=UPI003719F6DF
MEKSDSMSSLSASDTSISYASDEHSGSLINNFESFRTEGGYSDITLRVDGQEFPCHRVILAAGSAYFKCMFSSGMEESFKNTIDLKQIDAHVFEYLLHFIYTGRVQITVSIVEELFRQAYLFQVSPLVDLCLKFFKENMNETNCLAALTLGDSHAHRPLYEFAKEYACLHFQSIRQDEDFTKLSIECVVDLLSDRRLQCSSEDEVFESSIKWLDYEQDNENRKSFRFKILECIKFPLLSQIYLIDVVSKSPHVTQDERGIELYSHAITYHNVHSRRNSLPSFQITPRFSCPVYETAVLLGGRFSDGLSNEVESYRADTKNFTTLKQLPFKKRNEFAVCSYADNIYVSGGLRSQEFWKYDSVFETWIRGSNMMHARRRHAMTVVDDCIYVLGGFDEYNVLGSIEMWRSLSNCWSEIGTLVHPVENMGYVSYNKKIYLFGGKNSEEIVTDVVQCFDTITNTTTLLTRTLPASDMCLNGATLNGQIYVVGLEGCFRYTPDSDTWDVLPDLSCARDFVSLAVLDEKLYAFGGRRRGAKDNLYTDIIECFDPAENAWEICGNTPIPMYSYGCVRIMLHKKKEPETSQSGISQVVPHQVQASS